MLIEIRHTTRYSYGHPVDHALQRLRLTPGSSPAQEVLSWSLAMPGIETAVQYLDAIGNPTHLVICPEPVETIEVIAEGVVETRATHGVVGFDISSTPPWEASNMRIAESSASSSRRMYVPLVNCSVAPL